jgi:hypothetical protein
MSKNPNEQMAIVLFPRKRVAVEHITIGQGPLRDDETTFLLASTVPRGDALRPVPGRTFGTNHRP